MSQITQTARIRVLVADDSHIHTQLLADALRRDAQLEVIDAQPSSRELAQTIRTEEVNVVVLSPSMDEEPARGFDIARQVRASSPAVAVIMLLDSSKREPILQAFRAGARGIFSRHDSIDALCKCIRSVFAGQIWANHEQISFALEALASAPVLYKGDGGGFNALSAREIEVVCCVADGLTNRQIADRLGLSQHTIKNYLFRIYEKLGVSTRLELFFMALQAGAPRALSSQLRSGSQKRNDLRR